MYSIKQVYVEKLRDMNKHLKYCANNRQFVNNMIDFWENKSYTYFVDKKVTHLHLTYWNGNEVATYIFNLDGSGVQQMISGMDAFKLLQRMSHKGVVDLTMEPEFYDPEEGDWYLPTIAGLLWFNPKYKGARYEDCYSYDMNSAYAWALKQPIPDTAHRVEGCIIGKNQVGFELKQNPLTEQAYLYADFTEGHLCKYVYPLIESPFIKFVDFFYYKKNKGDSVTREKFKETLNYAVGYIRRKNPFIHSCILTRCTNMMMSLIDDKTLYCNTDSIVSIGRRIDLELKLGSDIGQFKIDHEGKFAYNGSGYQWNKDLPSIRGRSKQWFKRLYPHGFDILKDRIPYTEANKYDFDFFNMEVIKNEKFEAESIKIEEELQVPEYLPEFGL